MIEMTRIEDWEACLAKSDSEPVFVFKHSTRCSISTAAERRVMKYLATAPAGSPEFHLVKVIESRPVSNAIAEALDVAHKSPQLILIKERKAVWTASHFGINEERITEAAGEVA